MDTVNFSLTMKKLFYTSLTTCLVGCAGVPQSDITLPGGYHLISPKNVHLTGLEVTLPNGTKVKVASLSSTNDSSVITQSGAAQADLMRAAGEVSAQVTKTAIEASKGSAGIP